MTAPRELTLGTMFGGDFKIVRALSSGGMGAVYIAEQASTGKARALKLMHRELVADAKQRERFEQEARVGALIASDHVVQVIGAGVDQETGAPWMAMELLEGEDFAQHLERRGALPPAEVKEIFRQLCHALGAAHAAGIVHRDVKPENIFLAKTRSVSEGVSVKVLDFGIAKVIAESKTAATAAIGTPLWMAPEQSDPRAPITPAADVWSLGLIAFSALTGVIYWKAASDPHAAMTALMREILFEPMERASARAAELGRAGLLPGGFDAWFARCGQREPTQRFASATEAFEALGPVLAGEVPASLSSDGVPIPPTTGAPMTSSAFAEMPTEAYLAAVDGGATGPAVSRTKEVSAEAHTNPASLHVNRAEMASTAASPGAEPPRKKSSAARIGAVAAAIAAVIGGVAIFNSNRAGPDEGEGPGAQRDMASAAPTLSSSEPQGGRGVAPTDGVAAPANTGASVAAGAPAGSGARAPSAPAESGGVRPAAAAASSARPSASAAPRPFDYAAASKSVQQVASTVKVHCRGREGPKAVSGTIYFNPTGTVQRVMMDPMLAGKPSSLCVSMVLSGARVPPFDGDPQPYPTTVAIE